MQKNWISLATIRKDRLLGERAGKESRLRLLDFIVGDNYNRYLSKKVLMIRFALKRASVSRLGIRAHVQTLKVFIVLGAAAKEFVGDIIKIQGRFNEIEGLKDSRKNKQAWVLMSFTEREMRW